MTRNTYVFGFLVLTLGGFTACSNQPAAKQPVAARDKIHGKAQILLNETASDDTALNAGGPSVYLRDGLNRYRLFLRTPFHVEADQEYTAEGVDAQKEIDAIGDPDQGKNGYPLDSSCEHVVKMAWPGLAFDVTDGYINSLKSKVKRYPARHVFLVTKIEAVPSDADSAKKKDAAAPKKEAPEITVPAAKQTALLIDAPKSLPAPLWEPNGGTAHCKVVIDEEGKIAELDSGAQLCEAVTWSQFRYKPTLKGGHPVKVDTEVDVAFDPRK